MLNADQNVVLKFVDSGAVMMPIHERIQLYRGMAEFLNPREESHIKKSFLDRANILEEAQSRCAQLNLKFNQ